MSARPDLAGEPVGTINLVECLEPWFDPVQVAVSAPASAPEPVHAAMEDGEKLSRPTPPEPAQIAAPVAVSVEATPQAKTPELSPMKALSTMLKPHGRTVDESLKIGEHLLLLKESLPHGEFIPAVERLGVIARTAQLLMASAHRLSHRPQVCKHCFNESMLFALLPLDDDQLGELERTGCVDGLRLEDMAGMTVKQLGQAVRAVRTGVDPGHRALLVKLKASGTPH